jgi:hypothetical protein
VQVVRCAAWWTAEEVVVVEQIEERLRSEVICAFATGSGIESPTAGLDGDALFVLCPVGVAVAVVVAVVVAAAGALIDPKVKYFVGAGHLEY